MEYFQFYSLMVGATASCTNTTKKVEESGLIAA
jgi:hypothetical protein